MEEQPPEQEPSKRGFWVFVGIGVLVAALLMATVTGLSQPQPQMVKYSDFLTRLQDGEVSEVLVDTGAGTLYFSTEEDLLLSKSGSSGAADGIFQTEVPPDFQPTQILEPADVDWAVDSTEDSSTTGILIVIGLVAAIGLVILYSRNKNSENSGAKSPGRQLEAGDVSVTFNDVAGCDEVVEELEEVKQFLEDPERFRKLGANIPKGVLLFGPPGTGKTLLARAIAGEANVPFFSISGSDFVEMYVGVGASRVRKLFEQAKAQAPCVVFIDEIDAVGRRRSGAAQGGQEERENTLNQLLVEIDGFQPNENVIVIAASNRADILDPALTRPGRFDRQVVVDVPDRNGRRDILEVHGKDKPFAGEVDFDEIAAQTAGFCGADLANLINESALLAARDRRESITLADIEEATMRVLAGPQKNRIMTDREKHVTAVHEMGHAIVAHMLPDAEPVHKVTVVGRGRALGLTVYMPDADKVNRTKTELQAQLACALGGRVAEEIVFSEITTGAHNDLEKVTSLAQRMVLEFGMAEDFALRAFVVRERYAVHSDDLSRRIDEQIDALVNEARLAAQAILLENQPLLELLGEVLVERETINKEEFEQLMDGLDPADLPEIIVEEPVQAPRFSDPLQPAPDAWRAANELVPTVPELEAVADPDDDAPDISDDEGQRAA